MFISFQNIYKIQSNNVSNYLYQKIHSLYISIRVNETSFFAALVMQWYIVGSSHHFHLLSFLSDEVQSSPVGCVNQLSDLLINKLCCSLTVRLLHNHFTLSGQVKWHLSHLLTHAKLHNLQDESEKDEKNES